MTAEAAFTKSWRVGRHMATLTAPRIRPGAVASAVIEWEPAMPSHLSDAERDQYRAGRDAAIAEMAQALGVTVGVLDL